MVLGTAFAIIAGLAQLITAWLGYRVSARPIPIEDRRRHKIYGSIFVIAGILGAATVAYNGISLSKALSDIMGSEKKIGEDITHVIENTKQPPIINVPPPTVITKDAQAKRAHLIVSKVEFSPIGTNGYVNVWQKNDGDLDAKAKASITVLFPKVQQDDETEGRMEDTFFAQMLQQKAFQTAPVLSMPPHADPKYSSAPTAPPQRELLPQLLNGQFMVLVMGRFVYTDGTNHERHTDFCAFIQQNPHPVFYCQRHNEAP